MPKVLEFQMEFPDGNGFGSLDGLEKTVILYKSIKDN